MCALVKGKAGWDSADGGRLDRACVVIKDGKRETIAAYTFLKGPYVRWCSKDNMYGPPCR